MIVVDSSVWIDYFNGADTRETEKLDKLLGVEPIMVGDLILSEVLQGFRRENDYQSAKNVLNAFAYEPMVGRDIAIASADNYRFLRSKGLTVRKTIDVLIATFCIENGHQLLHADRDFDVMVKHLGLSIV